MKQKIVTILLINLFLIAVHSCSTSTASVYQPEKERLSNKYSYTKDGYSINIEEIDSLHFFSAKVKSKYIADNFIKITDLDKAKKLLNNSAEFDEESFEQPVLLKLQDRNNKTIEINDYYAFVAYFPEEDILLCEGGHSIDASFNLKNGETTELTGNPNIIQSSPNKKYRLNGYFGGQECSSYFIQKRIEKEFKKVISLSGEFEKLTTIDICVIGDSFWTNDSTLFITESSNFGYNTKYYQLEIFEIQ